MPDLPHRREMSTAGTPDNRPLVPIIKSLLNSSATLVATIDSIQLQ